MNLRRISKVLFDFDAHYPRSIIATVIFITVLFGWKVFDLELDPAIRSGLPRDHQIVRSMEQIDSLFNGSDIIIIAVEADSLFSSSTLEKLYIFQDLFQQILQIQKKISTNFCPHHILRLYLALKMIATYYALAEHQYHHLYLGQLSFQPHH